MSYSTMTRFRNAHKSMKTKIEQIKCHVKSLQMKNYIQNTCKLEKYW